MTAVRAEAGGLLINIDNGGTLADCVIDVPHQVGDNPLGSASRRRCLSSTHLTLSRYNRNRL